ncbi:hypothetical protein ANAPH1_00292 [Anaplasma phagocytophilum]|nr:hypothetical protein ANAPH1_00292 [Anaplasma phagocytophilum]
MMLLLDRLISLLLLLPKPRGRTLFSLLRRWRFLIPILMGRFVRRRKVMAVATNMVCMVRRRLVEVRQHKHCVERRVTIVRVVQEQIQKL